MSPLRRRGEGGEGEEEGRLKVLTRRTLVSLHGIPIFSRIKGTLQVH